MLARYRLLSHVRLSQAGIVSKRLDESSWFLAWRLPSTYPTLCCKEIWVSLKISVGLCYKLWTRKFCHMKSIALSPTLVVVVVVDDSRVC